MEYRKIRRGLFSASGVYRAALLASTALPALIVGSAAFAQSVAPNTTPQGGSVVAGAASIAQGTASTVITQTSQNTAINWQSFNVGSNAKVQFVQPDSSAIALNRVISATPSIIAGQISANGQLVLINQSGVVFTKGAQVNAQAIVVSTSDIDTKDFMAGRMNFSGAPNPGAKIINDGQITARQAGLVGLVAPQVLNNGVITASLGVVQLAAGSAFVLDLYGDRLISINVTQAVRAVDIGGQKLPALVTNRGLIVANGGKIVLTARDADALVTQLIDAGGTLQANSVGGKTGVISLQGIGGNINISGNLLAQGNAAGTKGGAIEAVADGAVTASSSAIIDASGAAGGGVVALGTDIARAKAGASDVTAPRAASVTIATGAELKADATSIGNAGTVTLLSAQNTDFAGAISVKGGPAGGDGGLAEISSGGVISLDGTVSDIAINGAAGEVLLDPAILIVTDNVNKIAPPTLTGLGTITYGNTTTPGTSDISAGVLDQLSGKVVLEAGTLISIQGAISTSSISELVLESSHNVSIEASISLGSNFQIMAFSSLQVMAAGTVDVGAELDAGNISLLDKTGSIGINANVNTGVLDLQSATVTQGNAGLLRVTELTGSIASGPVGFTGDISTLGAFTLGAGNLAINDLDFLEITGSVSVPGELSLTESGGTAGNVTEAQTASVSAGTLVTGPTGIAGNAFLDSKLNHIGTLGVFTVDGGNFSLNDAEALAIDGAVTVPVQFTLIDTGGGVTEAATGSILGGGILTTGTGSIAGSVDFGSTLNNIGTLAAFSLATGGNLTLADSQTLTIDGAVTVPGRFTLTDSGGGVTETASGSILGNGILSTGTGSIVGSVDLGNDSNAIGTLGVFSLSTGDNLFSDLTLDDVRPLIIDGAVTVPSLFTLIDTGGVSETATGAILGDGTLIGSVAGPADFGSSLNAIGTLADFSAGTHGFDLIDSTALDTEGTLTAATATLAAPTLNLDGTLAVTNLVALAANTLTGTLSSGFPTLEVAPFSVGGIDLGGTLLAGALDLGATFFDSLTGLALLEIGKAGSFVANSILTENAVSLSASDVLLDPKDGVTVAGAATLTVPQQLTLTGTSFGLDGTVNAPTLILTGSGALTESAAGVVNAVLVSGSMGGAAIFAGGQNTITTLADFTVGSNLTLDDTQALTIAGAVMVPGLFTLNDSNLGGVIENGTGSILGNGTLAGSIAGDADLGSALNAISTLAAFSVGSGDDLTLVDAKALTIAGAVTVPGLFTLIDTGGGVTETAGGAILGQGTLTTGTGAIAGDVALNSKSNAIATLVAFDAGTHSFSLIDSGALDTEATLTAATATLAAPTLNLDGTLAVTDLVALAADTLTGTLAGGFPTLDVAPFTATGIDLGGTSQAGTLDIGDTFFDSLSGLALLEIGKAGSFAANSILSENMVSLSATSVLLDPTQGITVDSGSTLIAPTQLTLAGTSFGLNGTINAPLLSLVGSGALTEAAAGAVIATLVTGNIAGAASLAGTHNSIDTLANFTVVGADPGFLLNDNAVLTIAGALDVLGTMPGLGSVALIDAATVLELDGGVIDTGALSTGTGSIGGNALLTSGNSIATLGTFIVGGALFSFNNDISMSLAGLLDVEGGGGTIVLADDQTVREVSLAAGVAGQIDAGTLTTNGALLNGDAVLTLTNGIGSLTNFSATGNITLDNDTGLLTANGILGGNVDISNSVDLAAGGINGGAVGLHAGRNLSANGVQASSAVLTAGSDISTANDIHAATVLLDADGNIDAASNIFGGTTIALVAGGSIQLSQEISAGSSIDINSGTDVTQLLAPATAGNIIITPLLNGSIGGNLDLPNANDIGNIGFLTVDGTAFIAGVSGISGSLIAADATLISTGNFALDGFADITDTLFIDAATGITQSKPSSVFAMAATYTSGLVTLSSTDAVVVNPIPAPVAQGSTIPGDTIALAGNFTGGDLELFAPFGSITQTGTVNAATISGLAEASASFTGPDNIQSVGNFAVQNGANDGVFLLQEPGNVTIDGPLVSDVVDIYSGGNITLAAGGSMDIGGNTASTLGLTSSSASDLIQDGNFDVGLAYEPQPPANAVPGTLAIAGSNVTITFAPFQGGGEFLAPNINLILNPGAQGSATGNIAVHGLAVTSGRSYNLTGSIGGIGGVVAAGQGKALPIPNPQYQFNSCPIGSFNCEFFPIEVVPTGNPLDNFDITSRKRRRLDKNVNLPGVAARDF